jgi:hypothetical protein
MALDFSRLPPEQAPPDKPPSRLVWTVAFFALTLAGVFAVLLMWPGNEPTQTAWFWVCTALYPPLVAAFIVSRRYSAHEERCLDATAWNDARQQYLDEVFARESIPMLVLGSAIRVTERAEDNSVDRIAEGTLARAAQSFEHERGTPNTARRLLPDGACFASCDGERHERILEWLFDVLLDDLSDTLNALPDGFPLRVMLDVSEYAGKADAKALWRAAWKDHVPREADVRRAPEPLDLMTVDAWLDDPEGPLNRYALLFVSVTLGAMLDQAPADGSAEAGVALLAASPALTRLHGLTPVAAVHRPMVSMGGALDHALRHAMRWAGIEASSLESMWMTGLNGESAGTLHSALSRARVRTEDDDPLTAFELDRTVGKAGASAGWLALTCGACRAKQIGAPQLVVQASRARTIVAVVRGNDLRETESFA